MMIYGGNKMMIEWLNCNQGFVMTILSLVYVGATLFICFSNSESTKTASKQLEEMKNIQQQNVNIQLFDKRHGIYYILWRWCDISKMTFNDVSSPQTEVFMRLLHDYCPGLNELHQIGDVIGSAKFLYPFDFGKAEEFRTAFLDMAYGASAENLNKLKASYNNLEKSNILEEMKKYLSL
jgi:hypothetical protein